MLQAFLSVLDVEKSQSRQMVRNGARRQLPLLKQFGLVFTNVPQALSDPVDG